MDCLMHLKERACTGIKRNGRIYNDDGSIMAIANKSLTLPKRLLPRYSSAPLSAVSLPEVSFTLGQTQSEIVNEKFEKLTTVKF